jgi:hypothetical protein
MCTEFHHCGQHMLSWPCRSSGFPPWQSGFEARTGFFRVLLFPLSLSPLTSPQSSSGTGTKGQIGTTILSRLSLIPTPPQEIKKKKKTTYRDKFTFVLTMGTEGSTIDFGGHTEWAGWILDQPLHTYILIHGHWGGHPNDAPATWFPLWRTLWAAAGTITPPLYWRICPTWTYAPLTLTSPVMHSTTGEPASTFVPPTKGNIL